MTDLSSTLRIELQAALDVLTPQIRGLEDLAQTSISPTSLAQVNEQIIDRSRRWDIITAVMAALVMLDADGYPDLPKTQVTGSVLSEIQKHARDLDTAAAVFQAAAAAIGLDIADKVLTPQPIPAKP